MGKKERRKKKNIGYRVAWNERRLIITKIFSRDRQDCTDSISTLVIIEENNKVLSDLPPSYASIFPIRVGIQKNLPANNFMLQQQMTVCGNCMGCIEYNMCMRYQKVMMD